MSFYSLMNLQHLKEYWAENKQSLTICCMNKMKNEGGVVRTPFPVVFKAPRAGSHGLATGPSSALQHNKMANQVNGNGYS